MIKRITQIEEEFYQSVGGTGSSFMNDNKIAFFKREVGNSHIYEGERLFLEKFILNNGGTITSKYNSDLWKKAVAILGLTPSRSLQENKRLFFQSGYSSLYFYLRSLPALSVYYPLNETSGNAINHDISSQNTLNGTVSGVTQGASGSIGNAYSFDGVGDRVVISGFAPSTTFSFFLAFKRNGTPDANDRILDQASGGPTKGWHIQLDTNGNIGFRTWNNSGASLSLNYGIVADAEWCTLGGSIGSSSSEIYLNGVSIATGGGNNFGSGVVADLQLGARSGGTSNAMKGFMQHVAIADGVQWSDAIHEKLAGFFFLN